MRKNCERCGVLLGLTWVYLRRLKDAWQKDECHLSMLLDTASLLKICYSDRERVVTSLTEKLCSCQYHYQGPLAGILTKFWWQNLPQALRIDKTLRRTHVVHSKFVGHSHVLYAEACDTFSLDYKSFSSLTEASSHRLYSSTTQPPTTSSLNHVH